MKLTNIRSAWSVEGMLIARIAPSTPLTQDEMYAYYGNSATKSAKYKRLQRPCVFERAVLIAPDGRISIVPLTPDIKITDSTEAS